MKILRQETLEHDNFCDSLLLYKMGGDKMECKYKKTRKS